MLAAAVAAPRAEPVQALCLPPPPAAAPPSQPRLAPASCSPLCLQPSLQLPPVRAWPLQPTRSPIQSTGMPCLSHCLLAVGTNAPQTGRCLLGSSSRLCLKPCLVPQPLGGNSSLCTGARRSLTPSLRLPDGGSRVLCAGGLLCCFLSSTGRRRPRGQSARACVIRRLLLGATGLGQACGQWCHSPVLHVDAHDTGALVPPAHAQKHCLDP